jgi:hypothetical protein
MKSKKNKLTNLLKTGILLFGISLFLWNCQTENSNDFTSENQPSISIEKIKTQFNASFNKNAFPRLNKEPLWEEAKTSYNQEGSQYIEIPFYKLYQEDIEMSSTLSFDKILVSKNIDDKLEIKIVHFFATDLKNKSIDFNQITHSELSGFNGFVTHFDLHKNPLEIKRYNNGIDTNQDFTYKDPKEIDRSLMSRDDDVANYFSETVCTRGCYYWEYSDGSRETISCSPWDCTSINMYVPNGGGGGGSNGASYNTGVVNNTPPDCKSFNFRNTTGLWQEAAVKNIRFQIYLINSNGIEYKYSAGFPQAVLFGAPSDLTNGGTLSPGAVASISAKVLHKVMGHVARKYGNSQASETTVENYFKETLKNEYPNYIPGGRINFNASSLSVIPSEYKTSAFGTGNCN